MTLVLETGGGVQNANSYVTAAFITTYLTERGRETENSWSTLLAAQQDAYAIAATEYIDARWGNRLKGVREVFFDGKMAEGRATFSGQPADAEVLVLGNYTYTFKTALSALTGDFEVLIGATAADTAANLVAAINEDTGSGTLYSSNIIANQHAGAAIDDTTDTQVNLTARQEGSAGNDITLTTTAGNITLITFVNGRDEGSQPLEFPRSSMYDQDGVRVTGIPRNLKFAAAEYAVRAAGSPLWNDPTVDASGRALIEKTIGPITLRYADGASIDLLIKPYPAADKLLRDYVVRVGTIRG